MRSRGSWDLGKQGLPVDTLIVFELGRFLGQRLGIGGLLIEILRRYFPVSARRI